MAMWARCAIIRNISYWSTALTNASGHADIDYPSFEQSLPILGSLTSVGPLRHTPLPPELVQEFESILL